jgi:hypothetical protein
MKHFYERNIIEIKKEYETFLVNIISPLIYEGFLSLYKESKEYHSQLKKKTKNTQGKIPSILQIFQIYIKSISSWTNNTISKETNRIRESSKCSDTFDDLIKAVIKSYIVLLTFNVTNKESEIVNKRYHENINPNEFIHKCYIETGRALYDFPEIFWDKFNPIEIKKNQRDCLEIIKKSIKEAIRKLLPMKLILSEYLQNDYTKYSSNNNSINISTYNNLKEMLRKDLLDNFEKKDFKTNYNDTDKKYYDRSDKKYYDRSYSKTSSTSDSSSSDTYSSSEKKELDYIHNKINNMNSNKNIFAKKDYLEKINKDNLIKLDDIKDKKENNNVVKPLTNNMLNKPINILNPVGNINKTIDNKPTQNNNLINPDNNNLIKPSNNIPNTNNVAEKPINNILNTNNNIINPIKDELKPENNNTLIKVDNAINPPENKIIPTLNNQPQQNTNNQNLNNNNIKNDNVLDKNNNKDKDNFFNKYLN